MLRFPIEWKLEVRKSQSNLNLNDEFTLSCVWQEGIKLLFDLYKPTFIEISRKSNFDESSISGTLSFSVDGEDRPALTFSKLIELGSASTKLIDLTTDKNAPHLLLNSSLYLRGVINIISLSKECTSDFETKCCKIYSQPKSFLQLSDDFERLLDPQSSCNADINLKCDSASIPAHILVLSARSPVFAAMFKTPMKETHKNEVDITDIDPPVLQAMLTYIYSGKTPDLTFSTASDLLFAAEKYQLQDLKRVCCDSLKKSISLENAMRILYLGDLYAENLKSFSMDYISQNCKNFDEFEKLEEWKSLRKEKSALAVDVLESVLKSKDQNKKS